MRNEIRTATQASTSALDLVQIPYSRLRLEPRYFPAQSATSAAAWLPQCCSQVRHHHWFALTVAVVYADGSVIWRKESVY